MRVLYYDCFAGISGDMHLGAMVDLGVDPHYLVESLKSLNLAGYELRVTRQARRGISGTKVDVLLSPQHHESGHYQHHERGLKDIERIVRESGLPDAVRIRSLDMFMRIARAEAKIHGVGIDEVHFHEVGAVDAIVDIVGAAICLEHLAVDRVMASTVELGGGFVACAHGTLPVPAPATVEILQGIPVKTGGAPFEMTTPTGAAILASSVNDFTDKLDFRLLAAGYGVGTRDTDIPNVLRILMGEITEGGSFCHGDESGIFLVECNIDDMNPELYEHAMEKLFEAGAVDVFLTPIIAKKSRPAVVISVLCDVAVVTAIEEILVRETTTLGLRRQRLSRFMLRRESETVRTEFGDVRVKHAMWGGRVIKSKPEYEDCRLRARERGVRIQDVYEAVEKVLLQCRNGVNARE